MQAQASRQVNELEQITLAQSQVAVKTLLSASFGCILFLRSLLPEENFGQTHLVVGDGKSNLDTPNASSQSSTTDNTNKMSRYKIMTVKRGFSQEGDEILDYLEKGAFHALERQYLRKMMFSIYVDKEDPQNIVETWSFDFTYHEVPGSSTRIPVLSVTNFRNTSDETPVTPTTIGDRTRAPTLGDVKNSIRNMVHKLIAITQTLEDLPRKRFATFKLEYYPHTPDDYEPPLFVPAGPERSKLVFSTHEVTDVPLRMKIGEVGTGYNSVSLEVHSIAGLLPSDSTMEDRMHVFGIADRDSQLKGTKAISINDEDVLASESASRDVVWDAEADIVQQEEASGLLGQRMEDGSVVPFGKIITGKIVPPVSHLDEIGVTSSEVDETQVDFSIDETNTNNGPSPLAPPKTTSVALEGITEFSDALQRMKLGGNVLVSASQDSDTVMNLETQNVESQELPLDAGISDNESDAEVNCDCAVNEYILKYSELALFRRALKIVETENPHNVTEFRRLVGATPPVAAQLWKRLESEGFVGPEYVQQDGLGMFEQRTMTRAKNTTTKGRIPKTSKTRYTKNPSISTMIDAYFDPSEGMERKHIGLGVKAYTISTSTIAS
ncbi:DNA binding protein [Serendipita sp. 397]|nr:DNA binding protein [Serendipita sp. 397]